MPVSRAPFVAQALALALCAACTSVGSGAPAPEQHARAADGLALAYEERGQGEPALLFVHGWCGERALWRATMAGLEARHRVLALDLGGHGASGAGRAEWTLASLAGDVVAVCDQAGLQDVILVGHSMGAPVALLAAARLRGRVRGVIGVDSLHDAEFEYPPGFLEEVARGLERDYTGALEASLRGAAGPGLSRERLEWLVARAVRTDRAAAIGLLRGFEGFALDEALSGSGVPVRAVNAGARPGGLATAIEHNQELADFDALILDGCGHFPMLEQPERFAPLLARWVEELSAHPLAR